MQRDANDVVIYGPAPVSSDISCKASSNCSNRTAPSLHRSVPSSGWTPRRTVSTRRRTSAESSSTRQQTEDYSSGRTLDIATRCKQEPVSTVLQPESPTRISTMTSATWSCTTRTALSLAPVTISKIKNSSNNSSTSGIYPNECRRFRIKRR